MDRKHPSLDPGSGLRGLSRPWTGGTSQDLGPHGHTTLWGLGSTEETVPLLGPKGVVLASGPTRFWDQGRPETRRMVVVRRKGTHYGTPFQCWSGVCGPAGGGPTEVSPRESTRPPRKSRPSTPPTATRTATNTDGPVCYPPYIRVKYGPTPGPLPRTLRDYDANEKGQKVSTSPRGRQFQGHLCHY